jgi:hypothetical protein
MGKASAKVGGNAFTLVSGYSIMTIEVIGYSETKDDF